MLANPSCPVCGATDWTILGERTYQRPAKLDPERQKPLRVLFDVWVPGRREFSVEFAGCNVCGMMIYLPRPSPEDLQKKYEALAGFGHSTPSLDEAPRRTRLRAQRLCDILAPHLPRPLEQSRILDFGGGDGRLLTRLVEAGATCELVDYCEEPVAGVRQIGRTVEVLADQPLYDAIVCSHVIEHLAEPLPVLQRLIRNLRPDGAIYVEVPVEVVKRMPAGIEPVTHCNFFIPESLAALMERAGGRLLECKLTSYPHPKGGWRLCAGAVATPGHRGTPTAAGLAALKRYLNPSLPFLVELRAHIWRSLPAMAARKLMAKARGLARPRAAG